MNVELPATAFPELRPFRHLEHRESKHMGLVGLTVAIPTSTRSPLTVDETRPQPRWKTPEFLFYVVLACIVIPIMFWIPMTLSSPTHPNYPFYQWRLSTGWLFGRKIDNSDAQYRSFRNNLPALSLTAIFYLAVKYAWTRLHPNTPDNMYLISYKLLFSAMMLLALHGSSAIKISVILTVNFVIVRMCKGSRVGPAFSWLFNGAILFANDRYSGYSYKYLSPDLAFLDKWQGMYPRWYIIFNITMLRIVSFNTDYFWACRRNAPPDAGRNLSEKTRVTIPHPIELYSYVNYISYVLYPPLYIAGPIITFNDYLWQHRRPLSIQATSVIGYLVRTLVSFATMEFILHFMYVVAIKDAKAWMGDSPAEVSLIGFWNLIIVWLKLLIPWRFFRLWALVDGIDPPENMVRCMANNYSTLGFWRSWHRSYNLWIIRYIYVPLGGSKNLVLNSVLVFTFVALWHDHTFKLLAWGWLVSLFILPELIARYALPASKYGKYTWYRHVCALGAVGNILMMMAANLVGFVIGVDGIKFFLQKLFGTWEGLQFLSITVFCLFVASQLMFEYREEEMRHGIYRRC